MVTLRTTISCLSSSPAVFPSLSPAVWNVRWAMTAWCFLVQPQLKYTSKRNGFLLQSWSIREGLTGVGTQHALFPRSPVKLHPKARVVEAVTDRPM